MNGSESSGLSLTVTPKAVPPEPLQPLVTGPRVDRFARFWPDGGGVR